MKEIWAIGGGKGGIGKSLVSSNLSLALAKMRKTVTVIDLDLGAPNLHSCLGVATLEKTLADFLFGKVERLCDVEIRTLHPGLSLISGFGDPLNMAEVDQEVRNRLIASIETLKSDIVILDLGAGCGPNTLDFFLAANRKIVLTTPESTSIENMYRFLKVSYFRRLQEVEEQEQIREIIDNAMSYQQESAIRSPKDLILKLASEAPSVAERLQKEMAKFQPLIILNQARSRHDVELGLSISSVCKKYFYVDALFIGAISQDPSVPQAVRARRSLIDGYPFSTAAKQLCDIAERIITKTPFNFGHNGMNRQVVNLKG